MEQFTKEQSDNFVEVCKGAIEDYECSALVSGSNPTREGALKSVFMTLLDNGYLKQPFKPLTPLDEAHQKDVAKSSK